MRVGAISTVGGGAYVFPSPGASGLAAEVAAALRQEKMRVAQLESFRRRLEPVLRSLGEVRLNCRNADWDGEGAKAITSDVITMAMEFASLLPSDVPVPQAAPETDGQITFEWFRDPGNVFTVSIYPSRKLGFAGVHGGERFSSVTLFDGSSLPAQVIEFARRTAQP